MKRAWVLMLVAAGCAKSPTEEKPVETEPAAVKPAEVAEPAKPAPAKDRAEAIARLKASPKWFPSLDMCPADVMPKEIALTRFEENLCKGDALVGCAERCENGDAQACFALGLELQEPTGTPNPISDAIFLKGCILGEAGACTTRTASRLAARNEEVDDCSRNSFRRTCAAGDAWGCAFLASAVAHEMDRVELVQSAERACKLAPGVAPCQAAQGVLDAIKRQDAENAVGR